jgi:hypothetical protein
MKPPLPFSMNMPWCCEPVPMLTTMFMSEVL